MVLGRWSNGALVACYQPPGYVLDGTDCNDANAAAYPGAPEICDSLDNDCDEAIDEGVDGDGVGVCADCDEPNPCQWSIPTEVVDLQFPAKGRLIWIEPADLGGLIGRYKGLRSTVATDFLSADCLQPNGQVNAIVDATIPEPDSLLHYLVYASSPC